jgi:hypothetical protein
VHAVVGTECGHRGEFRKVAKAIGLEGKMTATVAGDKLRAALEAMMFQLGDYPGAKLSKADAAARQTTRMLKLSCEGCGYVARTTQKWLDEIGPPLCACGAGEMGT